MEGKSGNLMSLMRCWMFNSLTADTALAGAAAIPAWNTRGKMDDTCIYFMLTHQSKIYSSTVWMKMKKKKKKSYD